MGIRSLRGKIAVDIWETGQSRSLPRQHWARARQLLEIMNASSRPGNLKILGSPPDIRLHKLTGDRQGQWSVSIHKTDGWRIVFSFGDGEFSDVEIVNYH